MLYTIRAIELKTGFMFVSRDGSLCEFKKEITWNVVGDPFLDFMIPCVECEYPESVNEDETWIEFGCTSIDPSDMKTILAEYEKTKENLKEIGINADGFFDCAYRGMKGREKHG